MLCVVTFTLKMSKHLSRPLTTALKCLAWVNSRSDSVQQVKRSLMNQWRMKISYDRDVQSMQRFNQSIGSLRAARSITLPQVTVKLYLPWVERRREEIHPLQSAREMFLWEGGEGSDQEMATHTHTHRAIWLTVCCCCLTGIWRKYINIFPLFPRPLPFSYCNLCHAYQRLRYISLRQCFSFMLYL